MAPHEVGFTDLGLFINTSHLGSKIHEAHPEDEGPEMDMTKLLGVHASCFLLEIQHLKKKKGAPSTANCVEAWEGHDGMSHAIILSLLYLVLVLVVFL